MRARVAVVLVASSAGLVLALPPLLASSPAGSPAADAGAPPGEPLPVAPEGVGDVERLQPSVRRAVERAMAAAAADGVELRVTSGFRSADRQARLFAQAVEKYGSPGRARRWVLPPEESAHVRGGAVDVGPESGARWLDEHGVGFGLCRVYDNEPWHFERLAGAKGSVCPPRLPDAGHASR